MNKVAFLSMDSLDGFKCYDYLLFEPFKKINWNAEEISWRKTDVDWNKFDVVIVRSTWDYQSDPDKFLSVLENINNSSAHLENSLSIIKWNMNKNYLKDLQNRGILIVDTIWEENFIQDKFEGYFNLLNSEELIVKPNISANADNTFWIKKENSRNYLQTLYSVFKERKFMIQPFVRNIIDEGEYSLFYFGGEYSHSILKKPKENDFRSQEEHGSQLYLVKPESRLKTTADKIINEINPKPLYARADLLRTSQNEFALVELELIEPSLYFNMDPQSPERFASVFSEWTIKI